MGSSMEICYFTVKPINLFSKRKKKPNIPTTPSQLYSKLAKSTFKINLILNYDFQNTSKESKSFMKKSNPTILH